MMYRAGLRSRLTLFARSAAAAVLLIVSSCDEGNQAPKPWMDVADPGMPEPTLTAALGGPTPVRSVCLKQNLQGVASPSSEYAPQGLRTALEWLGIKVVDEGCELTMRIEVTGHRVGAAYTSFNFGGRCFNGLDVEGRIVLLGTGAELRSWPVEVNVDPPEYMSEIACVAAEDALVDEWTWTKPLLTALVESFGFWAGVLTYAALYPDLYPLDPVVLWPEAETAQQPFGEVLAAALHHTDPARREAAAAFVRRLAFEFLLARQQELPTDFWQVVPHLIWLAATDQGDDGTGQEPVCTDGAGYEAGCALELIFYTGHGDPYLATDRDPAAWWALWEKYPGGFQHFLAPVTTGA